MTEGQTERGAGGFRDTFLDGDSCRKSRSDTAAGQTSSVCVEQAAKTSRKHGSLRPSRRSLDERIERLQPGELGAEMAAFGPAVYPPPRCPRCGRYGQSYSTIRISIAEMESYHQFLEVCQEAESAERKSMYLMFRTFFMRPVLRAC